MTRVEKAFSAASCITRRTLDFVLDWQAMTLVSLGAPLGVLSLQLGYVAIEHRNPAGFIIAAVGVTGTGLAFWGARLSREDAEWDKFTEEMKTCEHRFGSSRGAKPDVSPS